MKIITKTFLFPVLAVLFLSTILSSCVTQCYDCNPAPPPCTYGTNGYPGPAFFGLDWITDIPDYVWTNNQAIPTVFYYGEYYNTLPGTYNLYYEGQMIVDCCPVDYFWDVTFDIWVNAGTAGGCGFVGADGLPSYLMIGMGPYGPSEARTNKAEVSDNERFDIISDTDDEIVMQHTNGDVNVRVTFKKLTESRKDSLETSGVRTAAVDI